ncbi:hypothetical protein DFJ73DRAFT_757311 [Zopfochytrium polystomum]|nr:hypothetical protein DFJ73DRAFT_757311 [Zopfochytrium polystomum]
MAHLSSKAYLKLALHSTKYSVTSVLGFLLGSKSGSRLEIVDAIPVSHDVLPLAPMLDIALQQAQKFAEQSDLKIVGLYFANELGGDSSISPIAAKAAAKIDDLLGGGAVLLTIDNQKLGKVDLAVTAHSHASAGWKKMDQNTITSEGSDLKGTLLKLVNNRVYNDIYDFDNHLDDIRLNWLGCPSSVV